MATTKILETAVFDNHKQKYRRAKEAEAKSPRSKKQTSDLVQQASRDAISAPTGTPRTSISYSKPSTGGLA